MKGSWYLTYTINTDSHIHLEEYYKHPRGYHSDETFHFQEEEEILLKATIRKEALLEGRKIFDKALKKDKHKMYDEAAEIVYKIPLNSGNTGGMIVTEITSKKELLNLFEM